MKKQALTLTLSFIFGLGAAFAAPVAQDQPAANAGSNTMQTAPEHGRHHEDPNSQLQNLTKKLNLTADQQSQLLPILTDRQQQMKAIRDDSTLSEKDRHTKMQAAMQDSRGKIEAVLTDSQKQTWQEMRHHSRERGETGPGAPKS